MDSCDSIICLDSDDGNYIDDDLNNCDTNVNMRKVSDDVATNDRTPLVGLTKTNIFDQNVPNVLLCDQQVKTSDLPNNNFQTDSNNSLDKNRININKDAEFFGLRSFQNYKIPCTFNSINNFNANANFSNSSLFNVSNGTSMLPNNSATQFHPVIEDAVKAHVASELASFLQKICSKNSMSNSV